MRLAQQRQETDAEKREAESALAHHLEEMQEHVANLTRRMHSDQVRWPSLLFCTPLCINQPDYIDNN